MSQFSSAGKTSEDRPGYARVPVTAIVSTKNEERAIERCVRSLSAFDEVIVVDSMSDDRTTEIARDAGAAVVDFAWDGKYPKKKQWCLDNVAIRNDWVLFVDADEAPTAELVDEIAEIAKSADSANAYDIPLRYYFMGRELRHGHRVVKRALLRPAFTRFPELPDLDAPGMGELEGHYQPVVDGPIGVVAALLRHEDPDPISSWVHRHNKYSDWEAHLRQDAALSHAIRSLRSDQGRTFDRLPLKPLAFFLYSFILRRGFLDGRAGFEYAASLSWYYWLIGLKTREARNT